MTAKLCVCLCFCLRHWYHIDTVFYHLKQEVMWPTPPSHLTSRLPAVAAEPRLQVSLREKEL